MTTRRTFLRTGAVAGAAILAGCHRGVAAATPAPTPAARRPLRILILGGTGFIGPYQVRNAVERGHSVSIFTRGRRTAELPASVEHLQGDRNGQLDALKGKTWDAVIDNSATNPDWVRQSAALLKGSVGQYMFVSSTGVHYPYRSTHIDETTPVMMEVMTGPDGKEDGSSAYGVAKARSEREAQLAFGDHATIVRPTFIVGPGDYTDRFPYWPVRMAKGGEVLAPGHRDDPVQLIDVRDLTEWMVRLLENGTGGVFDAAGPRDTLTMEQFLADVRAGTRSDARLTWVDDYDFLEAHHVQGAVPWILLRGDALGFTRIDNRKSVAAGLTFRPVADTARDTLAWWATEPEARRAKPKFALTPEKEAEVLAAWKERRGARHGG